MERVTAPAATKAVTFFTPVDTAYIGDMKLLEKLDRIVRPIAIPNLTEVLVFGQVGMMLASFMRPGLSQQTALVWSKVFEGEVWRLITFLFYPPPIGILVIFYFLIFMMIGKSMEQYWGIIRYNVYFYLGAILTAVAGLIVPDQFVTGLFFQASLFLAFAVINPNYEFLIMFVIPVKVKWLALLQGLYYLVTLSTGINSASLMASAAIGNFLIFFGGDLLQQVKRIKHRAKFTGMQMQEKRATHLARHTCAVCGKNSNDDPFEDFRYCSKCDGEKAYCETHLRDHEHQV